jgi:hypothetical protein
LPETPTFAKVRNAAGASGLQFDELLFLRRQS